MKNRLHELRAKENITQKDLAEVMQVSQQTVGSWEKGRTMPRPKTMQMIEDYFGVRKEDIFFEGFNYKIKLNSSKKEEITQ